MLKHAEHNLKFRELLLQKADAVSKKRDSILNREEYLKWLEQVDSVLSEIEVELASHNTGKCIAGIPPSNDSIKAPLIANNFRQSRLVAVQSRIQHCRCCC